MRLRIAMLAALFVTSSVPMVAQTIPVDANGVKVVTFKPGEKIAKQLKGDNKKDIKKLVVKQTGDPDGYGWYEFEKMLSKLPNLEALDASDSESASTLLSGSVDTYVCGNGLRKIETLKLQSTRKISEAMSSDPYQRLLYLIRDIRLPEKYRLYPSLTDCVITNVWNGSGFTDCDSLYVNCLYENQFVLVLLPKENGVCFKKINNPTSHNYQILVGNHGRGNFIEPANANLDGAIVIDEGFLFRNSQEELVIPESVKYLMNFSSGRGEVNVFNVASSSKPLHIYFESYYGQNINKQALFDRPVVVHSGRFGQYKTFDSLAFNKSAELKKGAVIRDVRKIVFNADAEIAQGCGGSGADSIIFNGPSHLAKEAFGNVGTIIFNAPVKLEENYAAAKQVYVPDGYKQSVPKSSTGRVIEMLTEKAAKDKIAKTIELQKPGSLLSIISPDELSKVDSLTVAGTMNFADAKVLTESGARIGYLNLRDCIIIDTDNESGVRNSEVPRNFMKGSDALKEIILPRTATEIDQNALSNCARLKTVVFPPYLERIWYGALENCSSLEEVILPKSLTHIADNSSHSETFGKCPDLKKVVFNGCTLSYNRYLFKDSKNLKEIWLPGYKEWSGGYDHQIGKSPHRGVKVYVPQNVTSFTGDYVECEVYFQSPKVPHKGRDLTLDHCTIYCPKGATTSYYSAFGKDNKYVEADFPTMKPEKDDYALQYINKQKALAKKLEAEKAKKADAEWRRQYGDNTEPCMQCYGTGILRRKVGNTYHSQFCPYCNGSGAVRKR